MSRDPLGPEELEAMKQWGELSTEEQHMAELLSNSDLMRIFLYAADEVLSGCVPMCGPLFRAEHDEAVRDFLFAVSNALRVAFVRNASLGSNKKLAPLRIYLSSNNVTKGMVVQALALGGSDVKLV